MGTHWRKEQAGCFLFHRTNLFHTRCNHRNNSCFFFRRRLAAFPYCGIPVLRHSCIPAGNLINMAPQRVASAYASRPAVRVVLVMSGTSAGEGVGVTSFLGKVAASVDGLTCVMDVGACTLPALMGDVVHVIDSACAGLAICAILCTCTSVGLDPSQLCASPRAVHPTRVGACCAARACDGRQWRQVHVPSLCHPCAKYVEWVFI